MYFCPNFSYQLTSDFSYDYVFCVFPMKKEKCNKRKKKKLLLLLVSITSEAELDWIRLLK